MNTPKEIQKRYSLDITKLRDGDYREVLGYFSNGLISKEAVLDILVEILQGKKIDLHKYKAVDEKTLENTLVHELIHMRFPYLAHGKRFNKLVRQGLRGKSFLPYQKRK